MDKVEIAKSVFSDAHATNRMLSVDFIKKNGELRHMICHRAKMLESTVKGTTPEVTEKRKATLKANNMVSIEELATVDGKQLHQFRTVNLNSIKRIAYNGKVWTF